MNPKEEYNVKAVHAAEVALFMLNPIIIGINVIVLGYVINNSYLLGSGIALLSISVVIATVSCVLWLKYAIRRDLEDPEEDEFLQDDTEERKRKEDE